MGARGRWRQTELYMSPEGAQHPVPPTAWRASHKPGACQHLAVRTRRLIRSAGFAAAVLLAAGCGSQPTTDAAATGSSTSSSAAAAETAAPSAPATADPDGVASVTPFSGDTGADVAAPAAPQGLTLTDVRTGRHEDFDRVVFEFAGTGTPGWSVEYVDTPSAQGSGAVVDVPGTAFLQVTLQGTSYPYESGAQEVPRGPVAVSDTHAVAGVFYDATFEGTSVAWIGTSDRVPFRVYALTGPSRVVVDVSDAG
jgi:hypothetical protein